MGEKRSWVFALLTLWGLVGFGQTPAGCGTPEHRQFDFWVGEWEVFNPAGQRIGSSTIERILDGCAIQENWTSLNGVMGRSLNVYLPAQRLWQQFYAFGGAGGVLHMAGEYKDGRMVLQTTPASAGLPSRWTWSLIEGDKDRVRQLGEISRDGGQTWQTSFEGVYVRRK